jgi:glutamate-1-semialdehyde 2,1-aminomutase
VTIDTSNAVRLERSALLRERAHKVIPAGAHTYSKGDDQFPALAPGFIERASGSRAWDVDGNEYIDWGMGLRSVILGHAYPRVTAAVIEQVQKGSNFTRPSPIEVTLAEKFEQLIPSAQMVKFAKNGSDVTTAAIRLARAATGRDLVAICADHPFFSVDDWFIGTTPVNAGIPEATSRLSLTFRYNDIGSLRRLFDEHAGQVAAVILEPATIEEPSSGFLEAVRALTRSEGAVLVFDEMITGFRWDVRGAQHFFGVTPDLSCFGKALGNGFSVAALVGSREIMRRGGLDHDDPRVFLLSTTHGGETHSLAAALTTIDELTERNALDRVWSAGLRFKEGFNALAAELDAAPHARCVGYACSPALVFTDRSGSVAHGLRTLFMQEMALNGVLMPYLAPSYSHSDDDVDRSLEAAEIALRRVVRVLDGEPLEQHLVGPAVKPVFRRFNRDASST